MGGGRSREAGPSLGLWENEHLTLLLLHGLSRPGPDVHSSDVWAEFRHDLSLEDVVTGDCIRMGGAEHFLWASWSEESRPQVGMVGHWPLKASEWPSTFPAPSLVLEPDPSGTKLGPGPQARHRSSLGTEFRPIPSLLARASAVSLPHQPSDTQVGSEAERMATCVRGPGLLPPTLTSEFLWGGSEMGQGPEWGQ